VLLRFVTEGDRANDGLEAYLKLQLKSQTEPGAALLLTWIVELKVYKLNLLEKQLNSSTSPITNLRSG